MARAAVKAKQQAKAKAQPAKAARGRSKRRHSGGGNPNQQLFFMRLRRGQRWLYLVLALVFAATFAGVGVGSGTGGLSQLYSGLFGGGGNAVSKAQGEIKKNPKQAKGYRDLVNAYETKGDTTQAITALQSYLKLKKKDAIAWQELGGLQSTQAAALMTQAQQAQQAAQLANPSQAFQGVGTLGQATGSNPIYSGAAQQATSQVQQVYGQAVSTYSESLQSYQQATKVAPHSAQAWINVATAAQSAGQSTTELKALKRYVKLDPNSPQRAQIESAIKQLEKAAAPPKTSSK